MIPFIPLLALVQVSQDAPPLKIVPAAEAVRARDHIADMTLLQSLVPLQLMPKQIDQLLPILKETHSEYAKLVHKDEDALKALEPDLRAAREAAFEGKLPPTELEKRVGDANKAADARYSEARKKATLTLIAVLLDSFDEDQKAEIEKQSEKLFGGKRVPKQYAKTPDKAPKDQVQALALQAFIERVLLIDRTIPLLEKLKTTPLSKP